MHRDDWKQNLTPDELNQRRLDTRLWDEQQAAQHKRECPAVYADMEAERATREPVKGRNPRDVAEDFVANVRGKMERGEYVDRADMAYTLVLTIRHGLKLASDFERRLRTECGWRQKDAIQPSEPEPYEQHAMGFAEE